MILQFSRLSRHFAFTAGIIRPWRFIAPSSAIQTRLMTSKIPNVEISPANHGIKPLPSLLKHLDPRLAQALRVQNITTPTPIQAHGIPLLRKGYDVMGSAQTGTGKTLMFSIPLCERLLAGGTQNNKGPSALILNPTRELAMQTATTLQKLTKNTSLNISLATGGESVGKQRRQLNSCDILIGTVGRILQFVDERALSLHSITQVVVDEADRMLDLGFEPDLRRIARALGRQNRDKRRTVLCSATFPPDVQRVASDFMKQDYYFIAAGRVGSTHENIVQTFKWVNGPVERRKEALQQVHFFLGNEKNSQRVIVFCNTKDEAERMGAALKGTSVRVVTGDKQQSERNKSLEAFRQGKVEVLVATDVAARGLDVDNVGLVVQLDAPRDVDTFVHRAGRTGRAGAKGSAVTLLDGRSVGISLALVDLMNEANQRVPAWLLGMSYVAQARALEEEGAISAGGGGSLDIETMSDSALNKSLGETFSTQDFRSSADAGSWGSERDKSYHSFDEEAYSSLDIEASLMNQSKLDGKQDGVPVDESPANNVFDRIRNSENMSGDEKPTVAERSCWLSRSFERQKPSYELCAALRRIDGTDKIGNKPNRKVLTALSKRGGDQRLRFEYLGMFPFDEVSAFFMSRESERFDRNSDISFSLPRVFMVAEKPSIAKAIADALSGPRGARQKRGISRALPVYEFTSDQFVPSQVDGTVGEAVRCMITVTSVIGHVFSLGFVEEEGKNRTYNDPSEYFRLPVVKEEEGSTSKVRVVEHLRALAAEADHLVLWLDCDAEGENIAHEVIGVTRRALEQKRARGATTSPDGSPTRRVHRARFSAITKDALRDAFSNLVEPDAALSRSVDARQELDLRVGVAFTRLLTWRCVGLARQNFSPATKIISYGPCQTPALSFCVDRAREIEAFVHEDYSKVHISAAFPGGGNKTLKLNWKPPEGSEVRSKVSRRLTSKKSTTDAIEESATFDQTAAQKVVKLASSPNSFATVTKVDHISERINPPFGLNTVGLLSAGSKAMGMSPKKVMQVAEKLYSAGFISYPRTETTRYDPKGFDVRSMLRGHTSHPGWGRTASYLLRTKYADSSRPPLRGHDAGDHPPITCLKAASREEVGDGAAWRVYEFIARNFLGSLSDELKYTRRVAELELNADKRQKFDVETVHVDSPGFAGACTWVLRDIGAEQNRDGSGNHSNALKVGTQLSIVDARSELCSTRPPRFLQEHELIELMDTNRIGTDASMATHVNNIVERGYVALCDETGTLLRPPRPPRPGQRQLPRQIGRYLVPTSLGMSVIDLFDKASLPDNISQDESPALLSRPAIRAQMEEEVKQIAIGNLDKSQCLQQNLVWFEARYKELESSLTRQRVNDFARALRPIKDGLRYWQRLGAFEPPQANQQHKPQSPRGGSSKRFSKNAKRKDGKLRTAKPKGTRKSLKQTMKR